MSFHLQDLTTGAAVRSALGTDDTELTDAQIFDSELEMALALELESGEDDGWLPDSVENIIADGTSDTPDREDLKAYRLCRQFSKYFCALALLPSLRISLAYENSDSLNTMKRSQNIDFDALKGELQGELDKAKDALEEIAEPDPVATTPGSWAVGSAPPDYDPVTNEAT